MWSSIRGLDTTSSLHRGLFGRNIRVPVRWRRLLKRPLSAEGIARGRPGVHEDLDFTNFGQEVVRFVLEIELDSDFADQEEIFKRKQHGKLQRVADGRLVGFRIVFQSYRLLAFGTSPQRRNISSCVFRLASLCNNVRRCRGESGSS